MKVHGCPVSALVPGESSLKQQGKNAMPDGENREEGKSFAPFSCVLSVGLCVFLPHRAQQIEWLSLTWGELPASAKQDDPGNCRDGEAGRPRAPRESRGLLLLPSLGHAASGPPATAAGARSPRPHAQSHPHDVAPTLC